MAFFKYGILFVFLMHLMIPTSAVDEVGTILSVVSGLGGQVLQPVACLEESVLAILNTLLTDLDLGNLDALLVSVLGPELESINKLLADILKILS